MGSISKPLLPGYLACVPLSCFPNGNTESIARVKKIHQLFFPCQKPGCQAAETAWPRAP